ncbi:MAG: hypothetical protein JSW02_08020, partial [candidate division WOR-3 bacterium]
LHKEPLFLEKHGVMGILLRPPGEIKRHASATARSLKKSFAEKLEIGIQKDVSEIGGGSLSTEQLPTYVVTVKPKTISVQELARGLRMYDVPVYPRVSDDAVLLDFRTVLKGEEKIILKAFTKVLSTQ